MNLAEEFTLLAYNDDGTPELDGVRLSHGLGGALLLDLALTARIDVDDSKVVVLDPAPAGDPLLDRALDRIAAEGRARKPTKWVSTFAKDARKLTLDRLVETEVLVREQGTVLLIFPKTRYPALHGGEPVAETEARQRLVTAVTGTGAVEPRTAALCALLAATGLDRQVFRDLDRGLVKARLREISSGAWAATAVKKAIDEVQAAVMASVLAATVVTTTS